MSDPKKMYKGKVLLLRKDYGGHYVPEHYSLQGEFVSADVAAAFFYRRILDQIAGVTKRFIHAVQVSKVKDEPEKVTVVKSEVEIMRGLVEHGYRINRESGIWYSENCYSFVPSMWERCGKVCKKWNFEPWMLEER